MRVGERYIAEVTPSHGDNVAWSTNQLLSQRDLITALANLGFHQQDIGDAFYTADPGWLQRSED
jgi:hypothetical protein